MPYEEHVLLAQALAKGIPRGPQFGGIVAGPANIARSYADAPLAWALVTVHNLCGSTSLPACCFWAPVKTETPLATHNHVGLRPNIEIMFCL